MLEYEFQSDFNSTSVHRTSSHGTGHIPVKNVMFDAEKMMCCNGEGGRTLLHGLGGRGYGLANIGIKSGCYEWKVSAKCQLQCVCGLEVVSKGIEA